MEVGSPRSIDSDSKRDKAVSYPMTGRLVVQSHDRVSSRSRSSTVALFR